ncbi:MAG: urea ABC transporter substrate-binding protein [Candidatus Omnitrophica bacterium]|nr:urea ABC transporter substrate-binding protein [Candidatus Omnitrophota bacterium]
MKKKNIIALIAVLILLLGLAFWHYIHTKEIGIYGFVPKEPIKVGILHSLSGTMALSEKPVVDATLMAIEEINAKGGLLGRKVEAVVADGCSDELIFAREAKRLIAEEKVNVVFGCWTSASRKAVKPVFEKYKHLLFYPVQYEGLEESPNIIYTGAAPNQQIIPAVKWCFDNLGKRFFLAGSDYVFPHVANRIIKDQVTALKGEIVGEEYMLLGNKNAKGLADKIIEAKPDVILNTINGDSNIYFFKELRRAGITPDKIPVMSFSIAESEVRDIGTGIMAGDYAAWNYFQSVDTEQNKRFVGNFKRKFGPDQVTSDPMEAGYFGVYLWAETVKYIGSFKTDKVRNSVSRQSFMAPEGMVYVDHGNHHTWKIVRIGKVNKAGQFDIVWSSEKLVRPAPYPPYRTKSEWNNFLKKLYQTWGGKWANTVK